MDLSAHTILDGMTCGKPGCTCRLSARKGHGLTHCPAHDDEHPSLSVSERHGKVLFKCQSGCTQREVIDALKAEGLWPERDGGNRGDGGPHVTHYEIREPDGSLVAIHVRRDAPSGKSVSWQLADGRSGLGGRPVRSLPLYDIHELGESPFVIVTEGEKCREALAGLGFPTVGTVTGAATIPDDTALAPLVGKTVYLWPDADPPGESHMARIAERLTALGCREVKRIRQSGARTAGDAADAIAEGAGVVGIELLLELAKPWNLEPAQLPPEPIHHFTVPKGHERMNGESGLVRVSEHPVPAARPYLVEDLLPEGAVTTLYGDGGTGKSLLTLHLCLAVATGRPWLGRSTLQQPVLYVDAELDIDEFARRANAVTRGLGLDRVPDQLYYLRLPGSLINSMAVDAVRAAIAESRATFVVVDSVMAATYGGELERAQDTTVVMKLLASFGTVLAIDHMAKPAPGANLSQYRQYGSVFKYNLSRSVIQAVRADGGGVQLRQTKHNFGPLAAPFGVALDFSTNAVVVRAVDATDEALSGIDDHLPAVERVYRALARYPEGVKPNTLAGDLEMGTGAVRNHLTTLRKQRRVTSDGGVWRVLALDTAA